MKLFIGIVTFLSIIVSAIFFSPSQQEIVIINKENGELLSSIPVNTGDKLRSKFVHSYDKGVVWEDFIIQNDGRFELTALAYTAPSYDARDLTYEKAPGEMKDGIFHVKKIEQFYDESKTMFQIRVPYTVPWWLILGNQEIELSSLAPPGTMLEIKLK